MRRILVGALFAMLLASTVDAQERTKTTGALPRLNDPRLYDVADLQTEPVQPAVTEPDADTHDSLRNGTINGLIAGGVVGAVLAMRCGHPECGPLISISAGIGAAIGVGIDALISERPSAPASPARANTRRAPFTRGIAIGLTKRW